jgi:hypothetical protein
VEQQVGSALLDLLGTKVKEVKGITDTVNNVFGAFAGQPNKLTGDFLITDGVLETQNTQLENANAKLLAQGQADLAAWTMDMLANVFRLPGDEPYLAVGLNGALDAPNAKFTGGGLTGAVPAPNQGIGGVLQQVVPGLSGQGDAATGQPGTDAGGGLGGILQNVIPGRNNGSAQDPASGTTGTPPAGEPAPGALGTETSPEAPAPEPEAAPETVPAQKPEVAPAPEPEAAPAPEAAPSAEPGPSEAAPSEAAPPEAAPPEAAPGATGTEAAPQSEPQPQAEPEPQAPAEPQPQPEPLPPAGEPAPAEQGQAEPGADGAAPGAGGAQPGSEAEPGALPNLLEQLQQQ